MAYGFMEWFTLLFLIVFYFSIEIYQARRRQGGRIISFHDSPLPLRELLGVRARVELESGEIVDADISGCNLCMERFEVGDSVYLCRGKDGYVVNLPLLAGTRRKKGGFCATSPRREEKTISSKMTAS
ncbi:MAG: hypothetical protein QMD03_03950 [Syntrophales bacterium]|nr:hypothetical protein [Syntrophales bacterium]